MGIFRERFLLFLCHEKKTLTGDNDQVCICLVSKSSLPRWDIFA
jgi:hypothetical protein